MNVMRNYYRRASAATTLIALSIAVFGNVVAGVIGAEADPHGDQDATAAEGSRPADSHLRRAGALWELGRREEALASYREVVNLTSLLDGFAIASQRGYARLRLGQYDAALADFDQAMQENADDYDTALCRGKVLEELGRLEEAARQYTRLIEMDPKQGLGYLNRGNVQMRLGEHDAGIADHKRAIRLDRFERHELTLETELIYVAPESLVEFRFVYVPPRSYWVGYAEEQRTEAALESQQLMFGHNATPMRTIELRKGYFVLDREVTRAQFAAISQAMPAGAKTENTTARPATPHEPAVASCSVPMEAEAKTGARNDARDDQQPIDSVSWHEAALFCKAMQARLGLAVRLPTEVEWECAARGRADWIYPWGSAGFHAWAEQSSEAGPRALDRATSGDRTPSGVYDMGGNLSEWCYDAYQNRLFESVLTSLPYTPLASPQEAISSGRESSVPPRPSTEFADVVPRLARLTQLAPNNPKPLPSAGDAPDDHARRTYRGGSYQDNRFNCQVSVRRALPGSQRSPAIGFRPVLLMRFAK